MAEIFVFGSNLAGRHGKGSALEAFKNHGAKYGVGVGLMGNSYAIPTKDKDLKVLPLEEIQRHVDRFLMFAHHTQYNTYNVVEIGCGLAGYTPEQIAPMFSPAQYISNINLPESFWSVISEFPNSKESSKEQ